MLRVELIYDTDCPNVKDARRHLSRAFAEAGLAAQWQEWDRRAPESPVYARTQGSPTILVNGQDVADARPSMGADRCRLYADGTGKLKGIPSIEVIARALERAKEKAPSSTEDGILNRNRWRSTLAILPAIGTGLLPKLTCPACWPAYAGLLSSLGLGFINYTPYLLPLTAAFLLLSVTLLGFRAKTRRGYKPFVLGVFAAVMVFVGKFVFLLDWALYGGVALLVAASLWNSWPKPRASGGSCPACVPTGALSNSTGAHNVEITLERGDNDEEEQQT